MVFFACMVMTVAVLPDTQVTDSHLITHHDRVPRLGGPLVVTHSTVKDGLWSDPSIWNTDSVPGDGAKVSVVHSVVYDVSSADEIGSIEIGGPSAAGSLKVINNTSLHATHLFVLPLGALKVGTTEEPISAEIVINNVPLQSGTVESPGLDPAQYGNGLLVYGELSFYGIPREPAFVRLLKEPKVGDTVLLLSESVNWIPGDELYVPDTRGGAHPSLLKPGGAEQRVIKEIDATKTQITLASALTYNHLGGRDKDGVLKFLPHVANLTRSITVRSENPQGTRGHIQCFDRGKVNIHYAKFDGLGRTTPKPINSTTFDDTGKVTKVGTNQIGRYILHFHHLYGPEAQAGHHQFSAVGNVLVGDPLVKWGIAIHDSHFGLIHQNIVMNVGGAQIVTEDGSETDNQITKNFTTAFVAGGVGGKSEGGERQDGMWIRGPNNIVDDNVAAGRVAFGTSLFFQRQGVSKVIAIPQHQGACTDCQGQSKSVDISKIPIKSFRGNEAYGTTDGGVDLWDAMDATISDYALWNPGNNGTGFFTYNSLNITLDRITILGDTSALTTPNKGRQLYYLITRGSGVNAAVEFSGTIRNSTIHGMMAGVTFGGLEGHDSLIEDCSIQAHMGVQRGYSFPLRGYADTSKAKRTITLRGVRYSTLPMQTTIGGPDWFVTDTLKEASNNTLLDRMFIYDHNGKCGDSYQVFHENQSPFAVVPKTNGRNFVGVPEAGLTNKQAWEKYGVATAGEVAPCPDGSCDAAKTLAQSLRVQGLVFMVQDN